MGEDTLGEHAPFASQATETAREIGGHAIRAELIDRQEQHQTRARRLGCGRRRPEQAEGRDEGAARHAGAAVMAAEHRERIEG
jgi:hypothetical protein